MNLAELVKRMKSGSVSGAFTPPAARPPEIAPGRVLVKITGDATAGGIYTGLVLMLPASGIDPDGSDLTMPEDAVEGQTCYVANLAEDGASTHNLDADTYHIGDIVHVHTDGLLIIAISPGGGDSLPTPTALYQVLSITAYTSSSVYTVAWDWVRAHS